jgi:hypothetical protein
MKHPAYYDRGKEQPTSVTLDSETGNGRRAAMGSKNRFKLGLFGRQLLLRPRRHDSAGALVGELARLRQTAADRGPGRHRVYAADRTLESPRSAAARVPA